MSARTVTSSMPPAVRSGDAEALTAGRSPSTGRSLTPDRAAHELGLKRAEFELATHLGVVRTVPDPGGGGRRVLLREVERLCAQEDFPDSLRRRVRTVGTQEAAELLGVPPGRFTRLARLGLVAPVRVYLNRYRAVVWLYPAEELRQFAGREDTAPLLRGRMPKALRDQLAAGVDLRPRNWRGRRLGFLLREATDPWERAAAVASFLGPDLVTDLVPDPYERVHLDRLRPEPPVRHAPDTSAGQVTAGIMTARDRDEIERLSSDLAQSLDEAREHRPAPRPAGSAGSAGRFGSPPKKQERRPDPEDAPCTRSREHRVPSAAGGVSGDAPGRAGTASVRRPVRRPAGRRDERSPSSVPRWRRLLARLRTGRGA